MKIQPEFNIAAILSKISVAEVASNHLSAARREASPFESYFEAALQQIDDPQLAATIATLNESGMIVPDSSATFSGPNASLDLRIATAPEDVAPRFRTLQLLNGRSIITTTLAFSDKAIRPSAASESFVADANADSVSKQGGMAAASVSPAIITPDMASMPETARTVTAASVMPLEQTPVPYGHALSTAPAQSATTQAAVPAQSTASPESVERRSSTEAWLATTVRGSIPVTAQTVTAASVMPLEQIPVPFGQALSTAPAQSATTQAAVPAQSTASPESVERRSSTEAWLATTVRGSIPVTAQTVTAASVMPLEQIPVPYGQALSTAPAQSATTQAAVPAQSTASPESVERRSSTEAWLATTVRGSIPVTAQTVTAASVMPLEQIPVPFGQALSTAPAQSATTQAAVPAQSTASPESVERRSSTEAWLATTVRGSIPVTAQTVTAASVMPLEQIPVPYGQALSTAPAQSATTQAAVPAQSTASPESVERRSSTEAWLATTVRGSIPVTAQTVTAASVMPLEQIPVPYGQALSTAPAQSATTQAAVPAQSTASPESVERRSSTEAWLATTVRGSIPVTAQTVTAASVMPLEQIPVPYGQALSTAPAQSATTQAAVPAQSTASPESVERRSSTEAWLASSSKVNSDTLGSISTQRTSVPGASIIDAIPEISDIAQRNKADATDTSTQLLIRDEWSKLAGTAVLAHNAVGRYDQPTLLTKEMPAVVPVAAALISESAVQSTYSNQQTVSVNGQPYTEPAAEGPRTTERWIHVDDLAKQFGSVIQSAFLNRNDAGHSSLRVMLYPENMGCIEAEIIDNNKSVTVNLIAQNDDVVRLLKDHSQVLRDSLVQSGSFELNIQKERSGSDAQQRHDRSGSGDDRSQSPSETLPNISNDAATGSIKSNESGELDTYV
jgi:hypothetical protein